MGADGSHALVLLLMDLQHYGYLIAQFTWLWLFALGLLGYRSGLFPKWLSFVLMLATVCYVVDALTRSSPLISGHISCHLHPAGDHLRGLAVGLSTHPRREDAPHHSCRALIRT